MPVSLLALLSTVSSMFKVVLICINMHHICIFVKSHGEDGEEITENYFLNLSRNARNFC